MSTLVKYNGAAVFAGQEDPLVSKSTSFTNQGDNRVLIEDAISLAGELVGCNMAELITARNSAIAVFSESFKNLEIDGVGTFEKVKVGSINFEQSPYLASLPYTINLIHYPDGFEFAAGVSDPVSVYTYTENTDQTVSIQHEVSAKGVNTSSTVGGNALDNAKAFVEDQLGEPPRPALIDTTENEFEAYLVDFNETVDKINNTVSVSRSFESDPLDDQFGGDIILRYSSEHTQNEAEEIAINYNGTIDGGREGSMANVRTRYNRLKNGELDVAEEFFINESVTEDTQINQLSFSFSYISGDNEPQGIMDDFTITVEENSDSSLFSVSINGNLGSRRRGVESQTFEDLEDTLEGIKYHKDLCKDIYEDFYVTNFGGCQNKPDNINFNEAPINTSVGYNEYDRTISYSASFNDRTKMSVGFSDYLTFDYNMSFTPSLWAIKSAASAYKDGWIVEDLDYRSRGVFSINCNARSLGEDGGGDDRDRLKDFAEEKFNKFVTDKEDEIVETDEYVLSNQQVSSSNFKASFYGEEEFTNQTDYTGILGFYL